uniref:G_PROTEIN_RECEP_F1_2 domain-containing protein n=1 Tax=Onchocerca volvulus TaxID=6282 RepID=A0A8R1U331_ONCVO
MLAYSYCIIALFLILPLNCYEENATNFLNDSVFDIRDEQHMVTKYTVVVLFNLFLLHGIISNGLITVILYLKRDNHYSRAFILITYQLIICNLITYETEWINRTFAAINTFSFYALLHFAILWTLNRFLAIILPKYNAFFESKKLYSITDNIDENIIACSQMNKFIGNMFAYSYYITALFLILPLNCYEENATNFLNDSVFDIRDEKHMVTKYTVVVLFSLFLLHGIISNALIAVILYVRRDNHYSRAFILITYQLIICNLISFIPQIFVPLPEILQAKNNSYADETRWINRTFATINTFSFYALLHFAFLWTLNRFLAIILPKYNAFFESKKLYFLLLFVWLTAFAISFSDFYYCTRSFQISTLSWTLDCTKQLHNGGKFFLICAIYGLYLYLL